MIDPEHAVDKALATKLLADSTLQGLVGAKVHNGVAPSESPPYVLFNVEPGPDDYTMGQRARTVLRYQVKGLTKGPSKLPGYAIAEAIYAALNDQPMPTLAGDGYALMLCRREQALNYPEWVDVGGAQVQHFHIGGTYRIEVTHA